MRNTHRIRRHERGLRFRYGELRAVLGAGTYRTLPSLWRAEHDRIEIVSTLDPVVQHDRLAELLDTPALRAATVIVEVGESERANVWKDGCLATVLGPGRHALWRPESNEATRLRVERY